MKYKGQKFSKAELSGQEYVVSTFTSCSFAGELIHFTTFEDCQFVSCDFTGARFTNSHFENCSFIDSKLSYIDFANARFRSCNFDHAIVNNSIFQDLKPGSSVERNQYDLTSCSFVATSLENAVFAKCNLKGVSLERASLKGAVFERCNLEGASLVDAELANTGLDTSKVAGVKLSMAGFLQYGASKGFVLDQGILTNPDRK